MDIHQIKTFLAVAREGSITRASERLYLSQPAVSAHIKAMEETLGLALFERTSRGMQLTLEGQRLLVKAERTLLAQRELIDEAARLKGSLVGGLRLGASHVDAGVVARFLTVLAERVPEVEVSLKYGTSLDILRGIRSGELDAGFYNEADEPAGDLATLEVSRFATYLAARPGLAPASPPRIGSGSPSCPGSCRPPPPAAARPPRPCSPSTAFGPSASSVSTGKASPTPLSREASAWACCTRRVPPKPKRVARWSSCTRPRPRSGCCSPILRNVPGSHC